MRKFARNLFVKNLRGSSYLSITCACWFDWIAFYPFWNVVNYFLFLDFIKNKSLITEWNLVNNHKSDLVIQSLFLIFYMNIFHWEIFIRFHNFKRITFIGASVKDFALLSRKFELIVNIFFECTVFDFSFLKCQF